MRSFVAAAVLFAALAPAGAVAQSEALLQSEVLQDPRLAAVQDRLERSVAAAQSEGLPAEWLLEKIAEGLSKRVPAPRIAAAVDALLGRIRVADSMIGGVPAARGAERRRLVRAAVDALAAGVPDEALGRLVREVARGDRRGAPARVRDALTTVAELAERDFAGSAAVRATSDAWRRGRNAGLRELRESARRIGGAQGRDDALRRIGRGVGSGRSGIDPAGLGRDHDRDAVRGRSPR